LELCTSNHMIGWLTCLLNLQPLSNPQKVSNDSILFFLFMIYDDAFVLLLFFFQLEKLCYTY
jgi:hypothetical protein